MRTLLQGVFVEAEGARGLFVGAMPANSWLGSGAMLSPGSQDGGKRPLTCPHLHADPVAKPSLSSCTAGKISIGALACP